MKQTKLGRTTEHRRATMRSLVTSLLLHGRINTTEAKARQIRPLAEKLVTWGKRGDLHSRRLAATYVMDSDALKRLFDTIAPRYKDREGGYVRILKLGQRRGDAAETVLIELV